MSGDGQDKETMSDFLDLYPIKNMTTVSLWKLCSVLFGLALESYQSLETYWRAFLTINNNLKLTQELVQNPFEVERNFIINLYIY